MQKQLILTPNSLMFQFNWSKDLKNKYETICNELFTSLGLNIDIAYNISGIANIIFEFLGYTNVI